MIVETSNHMQRSSRRFAVRDSVALWVMRHRFPRSAVFVALALSAGIGLASSVGLRHAGLAAMWLRYPFSVAVSGVVFTSLLGVLARRAARLVSEGRDAVRRDALRLQFRRNDSELPDPAAFIDHVTDAVQEAGHQQADPRAIPAYLLFFLSITVILVCLYFVWIAPVLLAEIVVEGSLAGWLYRPLFRQSGVGCFSAAVEQTGIPVLILTLAFASTGLGFQLYAPRATTIAEVWQHALEQRDLAGVQRQPGLR